MNKWDLVKVCTVGGFILAVLAQLLSLRPTQVYSTDTNPVVVRVAPTASQSGGATGPSATSPPPRTGFALERTDEVAVVDPLVTREPVRPPGTNGPPPPVQSGSFSLLIPNDILERLEPVDRQFSSQLSIVVRVNKKPALEIDYDAAAGGQPLVLSGLTRGRHTLEVLTKLAFTDRSHILADCELTLSGSPQSVVLVSAGNVGAPCQVRDAR